MASSGRKVRAAVKRPSVGKQKDSEGPATPAGHGGHGGLVARIHIGALIAIHFDGDVQAIDQLGQTRIVITLAIDDVAPVAPDRADVQQDGLVFGARASEGLRTPFLPSHGLVRRGMQIGTCGVRQAVGVFFGHMGPFIHRSWSLKLARKRGAGIEMRFRSASVVYWMGSLEPMSPGSIGLRAGEALILAVVKANALFAETPA